MKKTSRILWGIVLVAVGIIIAVDIIGIVNINYRLFFEGWWTLFIIVPFAISLFSKGPRAGNVIGLFIGVALLLGSRGILPYDMVIKLIFPFVIIIIGIFMIFGVATKKAERKISEKINELNKNNSNAKEYAAVFSGQNLSFSGEVLEDLNLDAVFGGVKCDLTGAIVEKDLVINATAVFGGVDIIAPKGVAIKVKSTSIFGGVTDHAGKEGRAETPVIYVVGAAIFGGVTVK